MELFLLNFLFLQQIMFRTEVDIPISDFKINYRDSIMTLGSCFAENIGKTMKDLYLDVDINPFGVLYNPMSILNSLEFLLQNKQFSVSDLFERNGLWSSFNHSSQFSDINPDRCIESINNRITYSSEFIKNAKVLMLTFGTSWIYEEKESGKIVSNCHKLPSSVFNRRRLTIDEIVDAYSNILEKIKNSNPELKIIFSVSPVRHLKDTAHGNNLSKSILLLAIDELCRRFENVVYFPAYEILLDELRDYRFFADDMLHPSDVAVSYIWQRFSDVYFSKETKILISELKNYSNRLNHRTFYADTEQDKIFKEKTQEMKISLGSKYPFLKDRL